MRTLIRNKTPFYYASYSGKTANVDANGNKTGTYSVSYGNVTKLYGNVSASKGEAAYDAFGVGVNYSRTISMASKCPFEETAAIWLDKGDAETYSTATSYSAGDFTIYNNKLYKCTAATSGAWDSTKWTEVKPNFEVKAIANSLNQTLIAVKEVET